MMNFEVLLSEGNLEPDPAERLHEVEVIRDREVIPPRTRNGRSEIQHRVMWISNDEPQIGVG